MSTVKPIVQNEEQTVQPLPVRERAAARLLVHPPFDGGKKFYLSEFLAERTIQAVAFLSIAAILAVSRGAGEVAPILFTGAAYFLPELPSGLSSQFMELGYHIYVLTTQSTDVEATKPLLYATTFVLLILTFTLNFTAIFLRSRVRARMSR